MNNGDYNRDSGGEYEDRLRRIEHRIEELQQRILDLENRLLERGKERQRDESTGFAENPSKSRRPSDFTVTGKKEGSLDKNQSKTETGTAGSVSSEPAASSTQIGTSDVSAWSFLERTGWLNKLGVGLLIVGLLLLFNYSVEQGWITPRVRLLIGFLLSVGLVVWGFLTPADRSRFRQIAAGGGFAGLYISGFAAYYLYNYLGVGSGWIYMLLVTAAAFSLSLQEDEPVLAVLGMVGGLATPFLLYREGSQFVDLVLYDCLLMGVSAALYWFRQWMSLLWTAMIGGFAVLLVVLFQGVLNAGEVPLLRRWALQGGLLAATVLFWPLPLFRYSRNVGGRMNLAFSSVNVARQLAVFVLLLPALVWSFSVGTWGVSADAAGIGGLFGAAVLGIIYRQLSDRLGRRLQQAHLYSGFLIMAISMWLLFAGEHLLGWYALQLLLMHVTARLTEDVRLRRVSHLFGVLVIIGVAASFSEANPMTWAGANLAEMGTVAALGGVGWLWRRNPTITYIYAAAALAGWLAWIANLFWSLPQGPLYITVTWGLTAVLFLLIGYGRPLRSGKIAGAAVLVLTVGKLVLLDLSHLNAIWRILLFLGFGGVLLAIGYWLRGKSGK